MSTELPDHIRAFLDPAFYPHPVESVTMLQTHISWIFLTGDYAYKLKKPVDFGFLDFSTLEKRRYYCREELRLNRRLAPDIYLEVLPVNQTMKGSRLGGSGPVVDYCLKMRQFGTDALLSQRLEQGAFDPAWLDTLAETMAAFHDRIAVEASQEFGAPATLFAHIRDNLDVAGSHVERGIDREGLERLRDFAGNEARRCRHLLLERRESGHVRPCHGDLHLRNIALVDGKPLPFDCIEFNEAYRIIDTMNDIAFLVMDCEARNRTDLGMRFLSRYLEAGGDYSGLVLLTLYLFYRATVRGKVACLLAAEIEDEGQRTSQYHEAWHYFSLAAGYTTPPTPKLFMVGGLSGSGKSRLARIGAGSERAIVVRSDATRKRIAAAHDKLPLYGDDMHRLTYDALFNAARTALASGWPVILDATFLDRHQRDMARKLAAECGVPFQAFWLEPDIETMRRRVRKRFAKGMDLSDADTSVLEQQLAGYRRPDEAGIRFLKSAETWPPERGG